MYDDLQYNRFMDDLLFRSLKGETTRSEEDKVLEWRRSSPDHEAYYRELERLLDLTAIAYRIPNGRVAEPPEGAALVRRTQARGEGAYSDGGGKARFARVAHGSWWLGGSLGAAAAAVLVLALALSLQLSRTGPDDLLSLGVDEFATGSRDVATVQLRDGTVVRLAPQSRLQLTGPAGRREVTLDGLAYFAVAKMEGIPFTVRTSGGAAVVLGTRFEAEARGAELRLLVVEGTVALAASGSRVELGAGEMARAVEGALSAPVKVPEPHQMLDWTGNFLVFQRTPVEQVAAEIERYFDFPVEVVGTNLDDQTVTAWFSDATAEHVIRIVCRVLAARCSIENNKANIDLTDKTP